MLSAVNIECADGLKRGRRSEVQIDEAKRGKGNVPGSAATHFS